MPNMIEVVRMAGAQVVSVDKEFNVVTVEHHGELYVVEILIHELPEAWPQQGAVGILTRRTSDSSTEFSFRQFRSRFKTVEAFFAQFPNKRNEIEWVDEVVEEDLDDGD